MLAQLAFDRISHLTSLVMNKLAVSAQLPCYCYLRPTQCRPGWKVKKKVSTLCTSLNGFRIRYVNLTEKYSANVIYSCWCRLFCFHGILRVFGLCTA